MQIKKLLKVVNNVEKSHDLYKSSYIIYWAMFMYSIYKYYSPICEDVYIIISLLLCNRIV